MDAERQASRNKNDLSFYSIKSQIKEKAHHPSVSGTLIIFLILDLVMLIVGAIKKDDCPADHRIPLFLIVAGAVGIVAKLLPFINRKLELSLLTYAIYALYVFEFIWMIIGSIWVYQIYEPHYQKLHPFHCDKTAYLLAFSLLTIRWILLILSFLLCLCYCCFQAAK